MYKVCQNLRCSLPRKLPYALQLLPLLLLLLLLLLL
jgi:hypothetical protein